MGQAGTSPALVIFAHGSRDPEWAAPMHALRARVTAAKPGIAVELAFLEFAQPRLADAVDRLAAAGHSRVIVAPLFMAQGAHLKRDLAVLIGEVRARHPRLELKLLPTAGEAEIVLEAMSAWLLHALAPVAPMVGDRN
jgi:sirohydrochlorin cobaltochelatase